MTRRPFRPVPAGHGVGMDEKDIMSQIHSLVDEEHKLRDNAEHTDETRARMSKIETDLDQCWDLLRQRRAKRQYDENPDEAQVRPESTVESYLQEPVRSSVLGRALGRPAVLRPEQRQLPQQPRAGIGHLVPGHSLDPAQPVHHGVAVAVQLVGRPRR